MQELLFLAHRIPFPPNKGDKIRSYHLLKHLAENFRVYLGTMIDDEHDWKYVDTLRALCVDTYFAKLDPWKAKISSLRGFTNGLPLTLPYYQDRGLQSWVEALCAEKNISNVFVFSSAMAQYVAPWTHACRVIDFCDIDSEKWAQYAKSKSWPMSWVYAREAEKLLSYERSMAKEFDTSLFVSEAEASLFKQLAPESKDKVDYVNNGVDLDYFDPTIEFSKPYDTTVPTLTFTGAMDYWANVDAVVWFAREVWPMVRERVPGVRFYIIGSKPTDVVLALRDVAGIVVTGSVPDVRPYIAHATVAVAPLRIARGIQNKVLEAMAMAKPVVASPQAAEGISADIGEELIVSDTPAVMADEIVAIINGGHACQIGRRARQRVLSDYSWQHSLRRIDAAFGQHESSHQAARQTAAQADTRSAANV